VKDTNTTVIASKKVAGSKMWTAGI